MIVDAGGAFGSFSLYALRTAARARVIGIEPFPASYQRMCDVVARNDLSGRFSPVQATLGAAEDVSFMASGDQPSQFRRITGEQDGGLAVATKSLEQVFDEPGIEHVAYLQMDIEGGEYPALLSAPDAVLARIDRIGLEYHPCEAGSGYSTPALFQRLEQAGFEQVASRDDGDGYGMAWFKRG